MKKTICFLTVALFLVSCASHKVSHQPDLTYDLAAQKNKVTKDGVVLMTKPIHVKSELKSFFDQDLLKYGILPFQVSISNNSTNDFYLSTEGISLTDPSHNTYPILPVSDVVTKAKKSYWRTAGWGVAFGLLGAIPSMINVNNTNQKIEDDYYAKSLKSGSMPGGAVTTGLVFFAVPDDMTSLDGWEFTVAYKTPESDNLSNIACCLVGQIEKRAAEMASVGNANTN